MNGARPELLFVAGPQEGERAVLMTNAALVGRALTADVQLMESAASREQFRFDLTPHGWLMQNLSANGTVVNGKRYKKGRQLLLETGDVLSVGLESEILYVAPGDDPEAALAEYRQRKASAPAAKPAPPPETPAGEPAGKKAKDHPPSGKEKAAPAAAETPEQGADEEEPSEQEKSSKLKYVLFVIVLVATVLFGAAIVRKSMSDGEQDGGPVGPPRLSTVQIAEALAEPLEKSLSPEKAAGALDRAVRSYNNRTLWEPGDLFRCVKDFKLHRAYRGTQSFDKIEHERMAEKAAKELNELVKRKYDAAWRFERARDFRSARAAFHDVLQILPVVDLDRYGPVYQVIRGNVIRHLNYIKKNLGKVRDW